MKKNNLVAIGIEIDEEKMSAILYDNQNILADFTLATPKNEVSSLVIMLKSLINSLLDEAINKGLKIEKIGLAAPIVLDSINQRIISSPCVPSLSEVDFKREFSEYIEILKLDNSANCFLRAERQSQNIQDLNNVFALVLNSDLGSSWWVGNDFYSRLNYESCQIKNSYVNFNSSEKLLDIYEDLIQSNMTKLAHEALGGNNLARKNFEDIGIYVGFVLINIINLINPQLILIGGKLLEFEDLIFPSIYKTLEEKTDKPILRKLIAKSSFGKYSTMIGAALL